MKWFEAVQTGLPMCVLGAMFGPVHLSARYEEGGSASLGDAFQCPLGMKRGHCYLQGESVRDPSCEPAALSPRSREEVAAGGTALSGH